MPKFVSVDSMETVLFGGGKLCANNQLTFILNLLAFKIVNISFIFISLM